MTATRAFPSGSSTSVAGIEAAMPPAWAWGGGGGDRGGEAVDLGLAGAGHEVVVGRVVGDVAGFVGLLQPADPVLEPGGARHGPRAGQRLRVAQVGQKFRRPVGSAAVWRGCELHPQVRQLVD